MLGFLVGSGQGCRESDKFSAYLPSNRELPKTAISNEQICVHLLVEKKEQYFLRKERFNLKKGAFEKTLKNFFEFIPHQETFGACTKNFSIAKA